MMRLDSDGPVAPLEAPSPFALLPTTTASAKNAKTVSLVALSAQARHRSTIDKRRMRSRRCLCISMQRVERLGTPNSVRLSIRVLSTSSC